jgi:hypothetical protein
MIMACSTKDLVVKKMVYLYLSNYAASNGELTLRASAPHPRPRRASARARPTDASAAPQS